MLVKKSGNKRDEASIQMTPMIDIVFQLLIFFLLSATFFAPETEMDSLLPKTRGIESDRAPIDGLTGVKLFLRWLDDGATGRVRCVTTSYRTPAGTYLEGETEFATIPHDPADPGVSYGPRGDRIDFGYAVPDFAEIERYLAYRKVTHEEIGGAGKPLVVEVNFDDNVPTQAVVTLLDICKRSGIEEFTIAGVPFADRSTRPRN